MQKIVFHLNCLEQGGAERVVTNLSAQFAREGYEVIVATQWEAENEFELETRVKRIHVGLSKKEETKSRIAKYFIRIRNLRKMLMVEKPDILIAFAHKANYRSLMATIGTSFPVVIAVRTDPVGHYDALSDKLLIPWLFPKASGCVFQTEGQREFFPEYLRAKSRIILNPVNEKYIGRKPVTQRNKTISHVGRLVDFKNQPLLIRAFAKVYQKYPEYDLKIYGGDSFDGTKEILEQCIREHRLEKIVHLVGASDNLAEEIEGTAFFAFTSDWEGLPNALIEAMTLGLPVIATDCPCGGPKTIIRHGVNGHLIPVKDEQALVDAMCYLIEHPEYADALGKEARKLGESTNSNAIYHQWKAYLESICITDQGKSVSKNK